MKWMAAYDVSDNKRRNKIIKKLQKFGIRTQKSIFEVELITDEAKSLFKIMSEIIDYKTDRLFMFPISIQEQKKIIRIGLDIVGDDGII